MIYLSYGYFISKRSAWNNSVVNVFSVTPGDRAVVSRYYQWYLITAYVLSPKK